MDWFGVFGWVRGNVGVSGRPLRPDGPGLAGMRRCRNRLFRCLVALKVFTLMVVPLPHVTIHSQFVSVPTTSDMTRYGN